jgi:hypothetical protein
MPSVAFAIVSDLPQKLEQEVAHLPGWLGPDIVEARGFVPIVCIVSLNFS